MERANVICLSVIIELSSPSVKGEVIFVTDKNK